MLERWLKARTIHSWVDPRGTKKEEWEWAELNAFHSADVARQLLVDIESAITNAEFLRKKERGETDNKFDKYWKKIWPEKNSVSQPKES